MKTLLILLMLAITACANTQTRNIDLWRQANVDRQLQLQEQHKQLESARTSYLAQAQSCSDDTCRVAIAGFAALSTNSNQQQQTQQVQIPFERDGASKFRDVLTGIVPILSTLTGAAVNYRQVETSRDVQLAQYNFLDSAIGYTTTAAANIANAGPRIEVGGDYVSGTQRVGDDITTNTTTITETTTRDSNNNNRNNSNDDSNNGGSCASGNGGNVGGTAAQPGTAGTSVGCTAGGGGRP
jgi:hypothetical protein